MYELVVVDGPTKGQKFDIRNEVAFIGRARANDIQIRDLTVSRRHAKLTPTQETLILEDLESVNGTLVDGRRIPAKEGFPAPEGVRIQLGNTVLSLKRTSPSPVPLEENVPYDGDERRSDDARDAELIREVSWCITNQSLGIRETCERVLHLILEALPRVDRALLLAYLSENHTLRKIAATFSLKRNSGSPPYSIAAVEQVLREGESYLLPDTNNKTVPGYAEFRSKRIRSLLCVPMFRKSEVWGVLYADTVRRPNGFRKKDVALLENISALLASYFIKEGFQG
jgi:pSer/pThr/pTyr-binding forkhead associated (FHA) protein